VDDAPRGLVSKRASMGKEIRTGAAMRTRSISSRRFSIGAVAASLALIGCASESLDLLPSTQTASERRVDSERAALGTPGFRPVAPCFNESDYVSRAVVRFFDGHYTPRCLRLASGGTVVFQGLFAVHPLVPRPIETTPSPILPTSDYGQVEFEFPDHGFYPYQDAEHPEEIGVIWSGYQ
jgi:hypothetical protein